MPALTADRRWTGLTVALTLTVAVASFESTATLSLVPSVVADIGGRSAYALVFALYAVAELLGLVTAPPLGQVLGPAGTFVCGAVLHGTGLILVGTAPIFGWLLAGRVVQGFGAGLVTVSVYVLVGYYPEQRRGALLGTMAMCWALPALAAPVIAGAVAEVANWRVVLLGVPLFEVVALALAAGTLRRIARRRPPRPLSTGRRLLPALLLAAGVLTVLNVNGLPTGVAWPALGVAVVAILTGARALLPAGSLRFAPGLPTAIVLRGLVSAPFVSVQYLIPLSLAEGRGYTTTAAGLALSGGIVGFSFSGLLFTRQWLGSFDRVRVVATGIALLIAGMATTAAGLSPDRPVALVFLGWFVAGTGVGLAVTALNLIVLAAADEAGRAAASAGMRLAESSATSISTAGSGLLITRAATAHTPVTTVATVACTILVVVLAALLAATRRLPRTVADQPM
jgi:MFS family permease